MKITKLPIVHKIKHEEPIFTIHKNTQYIATGSMNGEMKLWDHAYKRIRTVKKHTGSIFSVRFSPDGILLASAGDDGRVYVFDASAEQVLHTLRHGADVTNVEWTPDFLLSADLDGVLVVTRRSDWSEARRIAAKWICTYSEGILVLYRDLAECKRIELEKGVILESLNCRLSFAPNNRFISVGLQFNRKTPTVDIFDTEMERLFSLVGHAAPSEITSFCPLVFRSGPGQAAVPKEGSTEDRKNVEDTGDARNTKRAKKEKRSAQSMEEATSHTLHAEDDMRNEAPAGVEQQAKYYVLAVASQDLSISLWTTANPRPFLLIKNFTGAPVLDLCWEGNVLYASSYDGTVKKLEFAPGELGEPVAEDDEDDGIELPDGPANISLEKDHSERKCSLDLTEKDEQVSLQELCVNGAPAAALLSGGEGRAADAPPPGRIDTDKIEGMPPRRLTPVMLEKPGAVPVTLKSNVKGLALFDTKLPDKLRITPTEPFRHKIGDFTVELNASSSKLIVCRYGKYFFDICGAISKVCFNEKYLVVYTSYVQVYSIETALLVLPFISIKASFIDLLGHKLLIINAYGDFTVLNLVKNRSHTGHLARTKGLLRAELHEKYYVFAEYAEEILSYHRGTRLWICLNPNFNGIAASKTDWSHDDDETITQLECQFRMFVLLRDTRNICVVAKRLVGFVKRVHRLEQSTEYLLEEVLSLVGDRTLVRRLLEELNTETFLQPFVDMISDKLEIK